MNAAPVRCLLCADIAEHELFDILGAELVYASDAELDKHRHPLGHCPREHCPAGADGLVTIGPRPGINTGPPAA